MIPLVDKISRIVYLVESYSTDTGLYVTVVGFGNSSEQPGMLGSFIQDCDSKFNLEFSEKKYVNA